MGNNSGSGSGALRLWPFTGAKPGVRSLVFVGLAGLCLLSLLVLSRTIFLHDLPLMHFISWRVQAGETPYADIWDMNGPATYFLHLVMLGLPGSDTLVSTVLMFVLTATCVIAAARVAGRSPSLPLVGAVTGAAVLLWIVDASNQLFSQRDMVIAACAAGALALAAGAGARVWRWALAGGLIGFAVGIKPFAAPFAMAMLAAVIWLDVGGERRWRRTAGLVAGGAAGGLIWLGFLVWTGSLGAWWSAMTGFNMVEYADIARVSLMDLLKRRAVLFTLLAGVVCVATALMAGRGEDEASRETLAVRLLAGAFALTGAFMFLAQGKGWGYQFASAGVFGLIAWGAAAGVAMQRAQRLIAICLMAGLLIVLRVDGLIWQMSPNYVAEQQARAELVDEMASALRALPAGMRVQPLDTTYGAVHAMLEAQRAEASPILYDFMVFSGSDEAQTRARQTLLQAIARTEPAILMTNQGWPNDGGTGYARIEQLDELRTIIDQRYELRAEGERTVGAEIWGYRLYAPAS